MKKLILSLFGVALIATAVYAASTQMKNTGAGLYIGTTVAQKLGFYGATPVVRQTLTNTAPIQIQVLAIDGSTNTIAVYTTTNQLNQVRTALVNLGLVSTDGN